MQNHQYLIWVGVAVFIAFIVCYRIYVNNQKNFQFAVKVKARLLKKLTKQAKRDADLKKCLYGVEIRKLVDLDNSVEDRGIYCLAVVWRYHRDFCVDLPELLHGFRVDEVTLGKDHKPEPCPLPVAVCASCGCDGNPLLEDPTSGEAGSINQ